MLVTELSVTDREEATSEVMHNINVNCARPDVAAPDSARPRPDRVSHRDAELWMRRKAVEVLRTVTPPNGSPEDGQPRLITRIWEAKRRIGQTVSQRRGPL